MSIRIIFMGTPEFAVASLDALVQEGFTIAGVVTSPDKPAGRGMNMHSSAVKKYAMQHGLHVLQPEKLKSPAFLEELKNLKADLQVVVAFRMLPEVVWSMPPMGTINVHASLLPKYRGAAPINWAIINGEKETGVTTFKLTHEIDTGNILMQERVVIGNEETAGELHDALKEAGASLLVSTIKALEKGTIHERPQDDLLTDQPLTEATHAPKIFTETCRINWNKSVEEVYNLIRGLSPNPGAFTEFNKKIFKIFRSDKVSDHKAGVPGTYETDKKTYLRFSCSNGYLYAREVQPEGKKRMLTEEFLRGLR